MTPGKNAVVIGLLSALSACVSLPTTPPTPGPSTGGPFDLSVVVTTHGVRLTGVTVTIDGFAFLTNAHGFALDAENHLPLVAAGEHVVKATKDGYTPVERHITIAWHDRLVIGLNPIVPDRNTLRAFRGDFCGVPYPQDRFGKHIVYTPMYPAYAAAERADQRALYKAKGYTHWPISVAGGYVENGREVYPRFDFTRRPAEFRVFLQELWSDGLVPVVFLMEDHGPHDAAFLKPFIDANRDLLRATSIGWELNDWMSDDEATQAAKDLRRLLGPDAILYAHMTPGHAALCHTDSCESAWWRSMVGTLTGILYQHDPKASIADFQDRLHDFTSRMVDGLNGWPTGFDVVAFEYAAFLKFRGQVSEQYGIDRGVAAMRVTGVVGFGDGGVASK